MPDPLPKQSWLTTLGWAAYLACSWTWCIGMFLPVLLVRDFGIWGFVVFAVPNVIGAGGMGWVLTSRESSERIVQRHGPACTLFSFITLAFHCFFGCWLISSNFSFTGRSFAIASLTVVAMTAALGSSSITRRGELVTSVVVWLASAVIMIVAGALGGLKSPTHGLIMHVGPEVIWLAPVCALGFLLCPYLDATFLKARTHQGPIHSIVSFGLGFGVLFAAMIGCTLFYAWSAGSLDSPLRFAVPSKVVVELLAAHMLLQMVFTSLAHHSALFEFDGKRTRPKTYHPVLVFVIGFFMVLYVGDGMAARGLSIGEIIYRVFMSFYGLIFPAYVWLCMIPLRGEQGTQKPSQIKLTVFAIAVSLAAPCFWMGFIERQTWWLGPGLGIVLLARPVLAVIARRKSLRTVV